jgi:anti-sigma factor RsiW
MDNCSAYRYSIQLYLDGELEDFDRREFLAHLENCAACRQEKEELRHLSSRIRRARPAIAASSALSDRLLCRMSPRVRQAVAPWRGGIRRRCKNQPRVHP